MKSTLLSITLLFTIIISSFSQDDKILMTIGNQSVSLQEFERIYNKNNVAGVYEKQPVEEYLDLFINFKLKVLEAESLGMDTLPGFVNELNGYRDQLAKPYLNDSATQEELMKQEYERMKTEVRVSHILLSIDPKASPEDTLLVYNKMMDLRNKILKGASFESVAKESSQDLSVEKNGGDIGWMTAFRTVWEFENAFYNTPVNQVSLPVRTQFGYHLVKVKEIRPAKGNVKVAHIFLRAPEDMAPEMKIQAENKIRALYDSLNIGVSFSDLAKRHSEDRATAAVGGELHWFGTGQMIPEFEEAAFALKNKGDYSKPVHSFYGWHLLQLIDTKTIGSYEEQRPELLSKIGGAPIAPIKRMYYLNGLKKQYNFTVNRKAFETMGSLIDTSVFSGQWTDEAFRNNYETLFTIADKKYTVADFAAHILSNQRKTDHYSTTVFLNEQFEAYSNDCLQNYEKDLLPVKYPEFRYILQEYHDGILLFDLTDKMVWSKAVQDSIGLENFYREKKSDYVWEKRAEVMIFTCDSLELLNAAKALAVKYGKKKKFNSDFVLSRLCKNDSIKNCIDIKSARFEKGDNEEVDKTNWNLGAGENFVSENGNSFVFVRGIREPEIKMLNEARGLVTADYQNFLEKAWIAELRAKYPVTVDRELLKTIK